MDNENKPTTVIFDDIDRSTRAAQREGRYAAGHLEGTGDRHGVRRDTERVLRNGAKDSA
jgi:hypothetical protein